MCYCSPDFVLVLFSFQSEKPCRLDKGSLHTNFESLNWVPVNTIFTNMHICTHPWGARCPNWGRSGTEWWCVPSDCPPFCCASLSMYQVFSQSHYPALVYGSLSEMLILSLHRSDSLSLAHSLSLFKFLIQFSPFEVDIKLNMINQRHVPWLWYTMLIFCTVLEAKCQQLKS